MCIFGHEEDSIRQSIRGDFVETIRIEEFEKLKEQNRIMREALDKILGFKYARVMKFDELKPNTHPVDIAKEALKQIEEMEREK